MVILEDIIQICLKKYEEATNQNFLLEIWRDYVIF